MAENEQINSIDRQDSFRRELETKISALDSKIENRVQNNLFTGILALFALIITGVLGYTLIQVNAVSGKMDDLSKRLTVIETKLEERQATRH